ncbi:caskin-1-like isoform X4 [Ostrea edulis]|uniref:caskin-1-like isoform X4 n=1 Tax=Ostrea edulis TaxID=37623 RepID=UPI0024AF12C8|nr:caskin-1-like isoform X4 [Ostrea edulis]
MVKDQDIIQAVKDRNVPVLQKLLVKTIKSNKKLIGSSKRININYQDGDGMSALHQASLMGNLEMMQMLLECHADVSIHDNKGMLALHYAAWQGMSDPVHTLLQWKSPVNEVSQDGNTPLHLACQHGHFDVVNLLLLHNSSPTVQNKDRKTPLDLACEFGRYRVVDLLLRSNMCAPLLMDSPEDTVDEHSTTPLHLAAKNGHIEIIRLLLQAGVNINRSTLKGTSLHQAALCGKIEVVRLLLDCGIDVNKANSYEQTALDIVNSYTTSRAAKDLKHLLKEASFAVQARAIKNYCNIYDPSTLAFKEGDIIKVLEQRDDAWKGVVISDGRMAKPGYFPPDTVVLLDSSAHYSNHIIQGKRVHMPNVPDLLNRSPGYQQPSVGSPFTLAAHPPSSPGYLSSPGCYQSQSSLAMEHFPPPPAMFSPNSPYKKDWDSGNSFTFSSPNTYRLYNTSTENLNGRIVNHNGEQVGEWSSLPAFASDIRNAGHGKGSPTNSNRNSGASSDSGRGYSTGNLDHANANIKPPHNYANVQINNNHRLSSQSYESGVSSRQSYHSTSSSSVGSLDRLEESGQMSTINVAELFRAGMPDNEVMRVWLRDLRFEEYCILFVQAGYDMATISHMTPQDLSAIGITKPGHRKRLKAEIARLNIHDGIPDFKPVDMMEWLHILGLEQYYNTLSHQGYDDLDKVTDITWEDLEEIGIQKLGHQKKITLAIERLKRINSNSKRLSAMDKSGHSEIIDPPPPLGHARWSGDDYIHEIPSSPFKTKKSLSGDNLNSDRLSQKSDRYSQHSDNSLEFMSHSPNTSFQPDVVAIQVKRHASQSESPNDTSGARISSFQAPPSSREDRDSTPTAEEEVAQPVPIVAPSVPKAVIKPKPVAKIIAKTKRSSKETSPEIIDIEKYEKNQEFGKSPGKSFLLNTVMLQKTGQSDHIYDQPRMQNSPKSPKSPTHPPVSHPFPVTTMAPVFVSVSNQNGFQQSQSSPTGRKVPPPPPPKRTNSISNRQDLNSSRYAGSIPKSALQNIDQNTQRTTAMTQGNPPQSTPRRGSLGNDVNDQKQLAFATCVQSLSAKFGSKRMETSSEDVNSSDGEDFPPPPPPIAMDIITPKIHNYGIPSKDEKTPAELRGMGKLGQPTTPNGNSSTNHTADKPSSYKYKAPVLLPVKENTPPPKVSMVPNFTQNPPVLNHVTTTAQSKDPVQNSPRVQHLSHELRRKDSTSSSDSVVSASSVDSNTLPFANENVGTIKQRAPTTKPSIVPINESVDSTPQAQGFPDHQRVLLPSVPPKTSVQAHLKARNKDIPEIEKYKNKPDEYLSPYLVKPIIINASAVTGDQDRRYP